jgi:aspartate aminotransferase
MKSIIANKLHLVKPSLTLAVTSKAKDLIRKGRNIISLGAGEPDFDTPDNVKESAFKAIREGKTKYTAVDGIPELKQAIVTKFKEENGLTYATEEISVGCGAKHVIFNLLLATLNPDDEVIIPAPYWVSYPDMVLINGGTPRIVQTTANNNFKLSVYDLEKIINLKTKFIIINSPSNPSGAYYSKKELEEISKILHKFPDVYVISDDIYEHIRYNDSSFVNMANISQEMQRRTFVVNSVSKSYAMTGWRIGYLAGNRDVIKAISKVQSQSTSNPTSISQYAAVEAITKSSDFLKEKRLIFLKRRNLMVKMLNEIHGISAKEPDGAFYIFACCKSLLQEIPVIRGISNTSELATFFLEDAGVAVIPGIAFGMEGFIRLSYATSESNIIDACVKMKAAINKLL